MKLLLTAFLFLSLLHARAQQPPGKDTAKDVTFTKIEITADYPGGERAWMQYLNHNLPYTDDAIHRIQINRLIEHNFNDHD